VIRDMDKGSYTELPTTDQKYNFKTLLFLSMISNLGGLLFG
jgi:hypothetical protein